MNSNALMEAGQYCVIYPLRMLTSLVQKLQLKQQRSYSLSSNCRTKHQAENGRLLNKLLCIIIDMEKNCSHMLFITNNNDKNE